jgi:hypothetical protein|tara:strand:- start:100 stop:606 length:507 start_codon:yes stop_codon:yes gene_type:complete
MSNKIYDLEKKLVSGSQSEIFKIIGKEKLIAKIYKENFKENAKKEYEIGKLFQMNSISVPKYIGTCKVSKKDEEIIWDAVVMEYIEDSYLIKNSQNYKDKGRVPPKMYNRGKELLKIEIEKIEHLPFKLISTGYSWGHDYQGLYSPLKDCIYLIDFGQISAIQKKNPS